MVINDYFYTPWHIKFSPISYFLYKSVDILTILDIFLSSLYARIYTMLMIDCLTMQMPHLTEGLYNPECAYMSAESYPVQRGFFFKLFICLDRLS